MRVMPSNNSGIQIGYLAGKFQGRIGWLLSPDGWRTPPSWMPYAIDNGAYGAWSNNIPWNEDKFLNHLEKTKTKKELLNLSTRNLLAYYRAERQRFNCAMSVWLYGFDRVDYM